MLSNRRAARADLVRRRAIAAGIAVDRRGEPQQENRRRNKRRRAGEKVIGARLDDADDARRFMGFITQIVVQIMNDSEDLRQRKGE